MNRYSQDIPPLESVQDKPRHRDTGGLPVASDATQRNNPRRTPESRNDREGHMGGDNQSRQRQATRGGAR